MRPLFVTIVSILGGILGAGMFLVGIGVIFVFSWLNSLMTILGVIEPLVVLAGFMLTISGLYVIFVSYGLWHLRWWAWWLSIIGNIIGGIFSLTNWGLSAFVSILISILWVWYLYHYRHRFNVKFGVKF